MKSLFSKTKPGKSQRDRMLAFYMGQDVVLTPDEESLKVRLNYVKTKLYDWSLSVEAIVEEIVDTFGVSTYRAERDVADANYLFGKSLVISKSLVAGQTVERIKQDIALIRELGKVDLLPKMYEALIKAVKELPADANNSKKTPKIFLYSVHGNVPIAATIPAADALQDARKQFRGDFEDIEHEEVIDE